MSELTRKSDARLAYNDNLFTEHLRVFDKNLPEGTVAHLKTIVEAEVLFLDSKDEQESEESSSDWFAQFREKDRVRKELDRLRQSVTDIVEADAPFSTMHRHHVGASATRLADLDAQLGSEPVAATEAVVNGIIGPSTDHSWRRTLIVAAEAIRFTDAQDRRLTAALAEFVTKFQDSNDPEDRLAVCSAIRSYVGMMQIDEVSAVARFLQTGHRAIAPLDTTLETIKMISRKFAANPPENVDTQPTLSEQLESIAIAFVNPHVLPHGNHAALVMNAVQALASMASRRVLGVIDELNHSSPIWFRQQLERRLARLRSGWEARHGNRDQMREPLGLVTDASSRLRTV